ncbi:MAG: rRNA maturation RNase YbeY [Planctomycetota bacterium]|nr:MAG: rRNA maturation RNase YbeY [Planctomycetota bacterium]
MDLFRSSELAGSSQDLPGPPLCVLIANETGAPVDAARLESAVRLALADSPYDRGEISVAIVDDRTIHRLNRQFLEHDYPTDVLSFPLVDAPPRLEGEIIASLDTAVRYGEEVGWPAADELLLYVVHGALHLAGYRDKEPDDEARMRAAEWAVLAKLGVARGPNDGRWLRCTEDAST